MSDCKECEERRNRSFKDKRHLIRTISNMGQQASEEMLKAAIHELRWHAVHRGFSDE